MRTPGRCTNHDHCWLGNARRDVWVPVDHEFVCPVCATPLKAPPIQSISARGTGRAGVTSLALLLVASAAGFGAIRLLDLVAPRPVAARLVAVPSHAPKPKQTVAPVPQRVAAVMPVVVSPAPMPVVQAPMPATIAEAGLEPTGESAARLLIAEARIAPRQVAPATPQKLILPVTFGRPRAPEDSEAEPQGSWHRRPPPAPRATGFMPGPGEVAMADGGSGELAETGGLVPFAQGDGDEGALPRFEPAALPATDRTASIPQTASLATAVALADQPARFTGLAAAPRSDRDGGGASFDRDTGAGNAASLNVAAALGSAVVAQLFNGNPLPTVPPARIDPQEAAQADRAPNPLVKLVMLPPEPAEKLAKPSYPPVDAEADRPGQVSVKCTITVLGEPAGCVVLDQHGGSRFTRSVMQWLDSGNVRYRPAITAGRIVPEPRRYTVSFVPEG